MNLAPALLDAVKGEASIADLLGDYAGEPSAHTRRPMPKAAGYPAVIISPDVAHTDFDGLTARRPMVVRDIAVYGRVSDDGSVDEYRAVESAAYAVRDFFHRNRDAIAVSGAEVVDIVASGPRPGPTDDDKMIARVVTLTIRLSTNI